MQFASTPTSLPRAFGLLLACSLALAPSSGAAAAAGATAGPITASTAAPPNTLPTAADFTTGTVSLSTPYTFATADFGYADAEDDPLNHVRVTAVPTEGVLYLDADADDAYDVGEELGASDLVSKADLDAGNLQFTIADGGDTSFTFDVHDGTAYSATTYTATIDVETPPTVALTTNTDTIAEDGGTATVTATLSNTTGVDVTVELAFSGTATGGSTDYSADNTAITILAGETAGSATITSVDDTADEGDETIIVDVTSVTNGTEDGTQQVTLTIDDDDNADLSGLALSSGSLDPSFDPGTTSYTASVASATTSITVTPTLEDAGASVTVDGVSVESGTASGAVNLSVGETNIPVVVTAEEGSAAKTYTVTVTRRAGANGDVTAASGVNEPVDLPSTADADGEAVDIFDFTLADGGGDGLALDVTEIALSVGGTATSAERDQLTFQLDGPDATGVDGTYDAGTDVLSFSGLSISVADGESEVYRVHAYWNDNTGLTDGHTVLLSTDGDTDFTVSGSGTQMGTTEAVTNGSGSPIDVVATRLAFSTQPAGAVSGSALVTQPVVVALDDAGNTDLHFSETVTLTESSAGALSGDVDVAATAGVAAFTDVAYTVTADQESFTLTADDEDDTAADLDAVDADALTADVVATRLAFTTEPAPTTLRSGVETPFTTVPVVSAVDANGAVDTDYTTPIALAEVNGAGDATLSGTGDTDADAATVTLDPVAGVATFTGLTATYTTTGASPETLNLRATSGGLTTATSRGLTAAINFAPSFVAGGDVTVDEDADSLTVEEWATAISPGRSDETDDALTFELDIDRENLFASLPELSPEGTLAFRPAPEAHGTATVIAVLWDDGGTDGEEPMASAPHTFTITITPVNDPPVAADDEAVTQEDKRVKVDPLGNDTDVDGDALTLEAIAVDPKHGTAWVDEGAIVYEPDADFVGRDSLAYRVSDDDGAEAEAWLHIEVRGAADAPQAAPDAVTTSEDTAILFDVLANDRDPDGETPFRLSLVAQPERGHAAIDTTDGVRLVYTPDADFFGQDTFRYAIEDDAGLKDEATVTVTVAPVNDAPRFGAVVFTSPTDGAEISLGGDDDASVNVAWDAAVDPEGDAVTYRWYLSLDADLRTLLHTSPAQSETDYTLPEADLRALLQAADVEAGTAVTLYHQVLASDDVESTESAIATMRVTYATSVGREEAGVPDAFALEGNYPNPFNPQTTIRYALPEAVHVRLAVYDALGREVAVLVDERRAPGRYEVVFEADALPSGPYLYRLNAGTQTATSRMILMK